MVICSRENGRIKRLRSLRMRKQRDRTGLYFVDGVRLVAEAALRGAGIEELVVAPALLRSRLGWEIAEQQRSAGVPCWEVTPEVFGSLATRSMDQGIGAAVRQHWMRLETVSLTGEQCWVAVEAVQYPGNLGTILRSSAAAGGAGVIMIGPTADPYDPNAVRASLGAIFSQRLVRTTLPSFAAWKQERGYAVIGTSPDAATEYGTIAYPMPAVLLMGSERVGLSPEMRSLCDLTLRIPMVGHCDSLNVAVAASLMLYEIFHQRRGRELARSSVPA